MNASESFEIAAEAFLKVTGKLPPGKHGCTHSSEVLHDWKIWCAAVEYMKKCRPVDTSDLLEACRMLASFRDVTKRDWENGAVQNEFHAARKAARAAIAKAEGREV